MAGMPGSGKSTLARAISEATGAIVLDKDVIKSAALNSGAEEALAAPLAYEVLFDLAADLARSGHSLVLDSPAFFASIPGKGSGIAAETGAFYRIIECVAPEAVLAKRLSARQPMPSQWGALLPIDPYGRPGTAPLSQPRLEVDTTLPVSDCLARSLAYLRDGQG